MIAAQLPAGLSFAGSPAIVTLPAMVSGAPATSQEGPDDFHETTPSDQASREGSI
jgi:hypothetical protein